MALAWGSLPESPVCLPAVMPYHPTVLQALACWWLLAAWRMVSIPHISRCFMHASLPCLLTEPSHTSMISALTCSNLACCPGGVGVDTSIGTSPSWACAWACSWATGSRLRTSPCLARLTLPLALPLPCSFLPCGPNRACVSAYPTSACMPHSAPPHSCFLHLATA